MRLKERLSEVRKLLLRNGYMLERGQDEATRIVQGRDIVDAKLMRDRDQLEKSAESGESREGEEYDSVLADLGTIGQSTDPQ